MSYSCGTVSWWQGENDANDFTGVNGGMLMGGAGIAPGKVGQAFDFDGFSQYVLVPNSISLNPRGSFSFEGWIYPRVDGEQGIIEKWSSSADYPNQRSYNFSTLPNRGLRFAISDDAHQGIGSFHLFDTTNNVIALNAWNHVVAVYDQATGGRRIYVNGVKVAERVDPPITVSITSVPVSIGTQIASTTENWIYFNGLIDELTFYNYALSDSEILAIYNAAGSGKCTVVPPPQIIAQPQGQSVTVGHDVSFKVFADCPATMFQWHLNGSDLPGATTSSLLLHNVQLADAGIYTVTLSTQGGSVESSNTVLTVDPIPCLTQPAGLINWWQAEANANDSKGTNNGTLIGSAAFSAGMVGQAFSFDGLNSFVQIADSSNLNFTPTTPLTVELWAYRTGAQTPMHLMGKRLPSCGAFQYQMAIDDADNIGFYTGGGSVVASYQLPLNTWTHLAVTFSGNSLRLYTNGALAATGSGNLGAAVSAPLKIGGSGDCAPFAGLIDEVSLYNRALTAAEVQSLFISGSSGKCIGPVPVSIFDQPLSQTVYAGSNVSFSATSSGSSPISYGWNFNGVALSGATNSVLTLTNVQAPNAGAYTVVLTNSYGSITSSVATLQVLAFSPKILTSSQSQTVPAGAQVTLTCVASGSPTLSYQWIFNGTNLVSATNSSLILTNVQNPLAGSYAAIVTNLYGRATSSVAVLQVNTTPPSFTLQPASQTVYAGSDALLTVGASGSPPLSYQWRLNGTNVTGATSTTLALNFVQANQAGNYSVIVTNFGGSVVSSNAALSVVPAFCVPPAANLVGWWAAEGNANNNMGSNHGVLPAGVSFAPGKVGQAFVFNGTNTIQIADAPGLNFSPTSSITVELWAYRTGSQTTMHFIGKRKSGCGSSEYQMAFDPAFGLQFSSDSGSVRTGVQMPMNRWMHLAATFDGATFRFYTNGVLAAAGTGTLGPTNNVPLLIGGSSSCPAFVGLLDEVSLYNRALSAAEIQAIYNATSLGKCAMAPVFASQPQGQTVTPGTNVTFAASIVGSNPFGYQWSFNGTPLANATNSTLTISNVASANSGIYRLTVTNSAGSAISSNATLKVITIFAFADGQPFTNSSVAFAGPFSLQLQTVFTNGYIFYTLDGSAPSFGSLQYVGPFTMANNCILRAIAYSTDFFQSGQLDPIAITFPPHYSLAVSSQGGGSVTLNPAGGSYLSNSVVTVTAVPASGWTFFQWLGDVVGTNLSATVTMDADKSIQAVFGTTLNTTAAGGGTVLLNPPGALYPYGTTVQLSAIPQSGSYFGLWGNAASGSVNPLLFTITNPTPTVSSLFAALNSGQVALSVAPVGHGKVSVTPRANFYALNQTVNISAIPDARQVFLGWSGDVVGTNNPLTLVLTGSRTIYANFSKQPVLHLDILSARQTNNCVLTIAGDAGDWYQMQSSTNLAQWNTMLNLSNAFGTIQFMDSQSTNADPRFYRGMLLP